MIFNKKILNISDFKIHVHVHFHWNCPNNLILSYLSNREQFVSIDGVNYNTLNVNCGVLQGSSLGPLLFLIYINYFRFCLNKTETGHFADDTYIL